jgi:hypothetical protein
MGRHTTTDGTPAQGQRSGEVGWPAPPNKGHGLGWPGDLSADDAEPAQPGRLFRTVPAA